MGDECLVGVIPLEAMDLVIDLKNQTLAVNPAYPHAPLLRVPYSAELLELLTPQLGRR